MPEATYVSTTDNPDLKILLEPYNYICANPGKAFRTHLTEAFNLWLKLPKEQLEVIAKVMEMLHNASLLIDDVQDNSELRRGNPVAHRIYGVPITINCANYVYFLALEEVIKMEKPNLVRIYSEELGNLHKGQGMELHCRERSICPSMEMYLEMVSNKTGGLLRLGIKMMQELSSHTGDYIHLVDILGKIYQIRDDYINLKATEYYDAKGFCEDLTEGKYSFPIIHSLNNAKNPNQLSYIVKQKTQDIEVKRYALKLIEATNSFEYTQEYLKNLFVEAKAEIKRLGGNEQLESLLDKLGTGLDQKVGASPKNL